MFYNSYTIQDVKENKIRVHNNGLSASAMTGSVFGTKYVSAWHHGY